MIYAACILGGMFLGGLVDTYQDPDCGAATALGFFGLLVLGILYVGKVYL